MKLDDERIRENLRKFIVINYGSNAAFADSVGYTAQSVTNVLKGRQAVPLSWLSLMGYESVTIYRKVKK